MRLLADKYVQPERGIVLVVPLDELHKSLLFFYPFSHQIDDLWIRGHYDPETSNDSPAVSGLGSTGLSVVGSQVS